MTTIRRQISVACAPTKVFAVLADVERLAEFSHMTVAVTNAPGRMLADRVVFEQRHEHDAEQILVGLKTLCEGVSPR